MEEFICSVLGQRNLTPADAGDRFNGYAHAGQSSAVRVGEVSNLHPPESGGRPAVAGDAQTRKSPPGSGCRGGSG